MSKDSIGHYVFLQGHCGRIEAKDGSTLFIRVDEHSHPGKVGEARAHFQSHHETGEPFPGTGLWANEEAVRVTALRWDPERNVLRLKVERVNPPPP